MSHVITLLIPALVLSFAFIMTMDFISGLVALTSNTQQVTVLEEVVEEELTTSATLNWLLSVVVEEEVVEEEVNVLSLAKSRIPALVLAQEIVDCLVDLTTLNIRELKRMASERKIKGYGKMKKHELITALS